MTKNNKNSFVIDTVSAETKGTVRFYLGELINNAQELGLTISGLDRPPVLNGIDQATLGNLITIGTSGTHDMDWIRRRQFAAERGLKPILNLVEDWAEIQERLALYAVEKKSFVTRTGDKVTFHKGFVKVGNTIITNEEVAKMYKRLA